MRRRDRDQTSNRKTRHNGRILISIETRQHRRLIVNGILRHASAETILTGLASRHSRQLICCPRSSFLSTFPRTLRSIPVTGLHRYYGRSDSCAAGSSVAWRQHEHLLCAEQVSLFNAPELPIPPSPNTRQSLDVAFARYPLAHQVSRFLGFRLHQRLAGSPALAGRIEFVSLRMDRSPPACSPPRLMTTQLHSATGRRTYTWRGLSPPCSSALVGALARH